MRKRPKTASLTVYTMAHFCVDFSCFFMLFAGFKGGSGSWESAAVGFLVYNIIAFGLQPVLGFICDENPKISLGIVGCIFIIIGLFCVNYQIYKWFPLILCAFGNACFHIAGGIDSLRHAEGKMKRSGIFVSTGAVGVGLGTIMGQDGHTGVIVPIVLMVLSAVLLFLFAREPEGEAAFKGCRFDVASDRPFAFVLCLAFVSVFIRAFAGSLISINWGGTAILLLPAVCACIGKAAGGFLGDRYGAKTVGLGALLISLPFLGLGGEVPYIALPGIFLFNIAMPITLCAMASKLPQNPGLAFGLSTLALLCGSTLNFFYKVPGDFRNMVLIVLVVMAGIFIALSTKNRRSK